MRRSLFGSIAIAVCLAASGTVWAQDDDIVLLRGVVFPSTITVARPLCLSAERATDIAGYFELHFRLPTGMPTPYFSATLSGQAEKIAFWLDRYLKFRCTIVPVGTGLAVYPASRHGEDRAVLLAQALSRSIQINSMFGFELTKPGSVEPRFVFITSLPR